MKLSFQMHKCVFCVIYFKFFSSFCVFLRMGPILGHHVFNPNLFSVSLEITVEKLLYPKDEGICL